MGDCFKFLWPFQDVQTLSREEKEKKRKVRVVYKSIIIRVCTCPMWSNFPRDFGILFQWHMVLRYSLNLEFRVLSIHSMSWFLHIHIFSAFKLQIFWEDYKNLKKTPPILLWCYVLIIQFQNPVGYFFSNFIMAFSQYLN